MRLLSDGGRITIDGVQSVVAGKRGEVPRLLLTRGSSLHNLFHFTNWNVEPNQENPI